MVRRLLGDRVLDYQIGLFGGFIVKDVCAILIHALGDSFI
jgi:hypothetical protein